MRTAESKLMSYSVPANAGVLGVRAVIIIAVMVPHVP